MNRPRESVPRLSAEELGEAARVEQMLGAWKAQAMLFPTETAQWLLTRGELDITVESAHIVQMAETTQPLVQAVPAEPEQPPPRDVHREALAELLVSAMRRNVPEGMSIEREQIDSRAAQRERKSRLSRLPFPVVLNVRGSVDGGKPRGSRCTRRSRPDQPVSRGRSPI